MVGLLPLCAVTVFEGEFREKYPELMKRFQDFLQARPELITFIHDPGKTGQNGRRLGAILDETKLRRVLAKMLDEKEFLSPYGIRSLSRFHADHPFVFHVGGQEFRVPYLPGESDTGMFGGNSNWRGPIWMPVNALIIRALLQYYAYYGNDVHHRMSHRLRQQDEPLSSRRGNLSQRLANMFLKDKSGRRPVNGGEQKFQEDPHWRDCLQFYEYFHGDNGAGLGANHQTGWTGVIARAMHLFATTNAEQVLQLGKRAGVVEVHQPVAAPVEKPPARRPRKNKFAPQPGQ